MTISNNDLIFFTRANKSHSQKLEPQEMTIGKSKSVPSGKKVEAPDSDDDDEFDNNLDRYP